MSFNASFGILCGILTIALMYVGVYQNPSAILWAGYASILAGIVLLVNTYIIERGAYVGTILAPVMKLSMLLLILIGISLVYEPVNLIALSIVPNLEIIAFYAFIIIFALALLHIITNK